MTRSILTPIGTSPIAKAEYLNCVLYARKFTSEDIWFSSSGSHYPNLDEAAVNLIDNGETAWGIPEFEESLLDIFERWAEDGLLIRAKLYAQWLLTTNPDRSSREWLEDFAQGRVCQELSIYSLCCPILGSPDDYLYPFQFDRLVAAQRRRENNRVWRIRNGAQLAYQRFGLIPD